MWMATLEGVIEKVTCPLPEISKAEFYSVLKIMDFEVTPSFFQLVDLIESLQMGLKRESNGAPVFNQHTLPVALHFAYWGKKIAASDPPCYGAQFNEYSIQDGVVIALTHDLVEDHLLKPRELKTLVGPKLTFAVYYMTKPTVVQESGERQLVYELRREKASIDLLSQGPPIVVAEKGADRLNNLNSMPLLDEAKQDTYIEKTLIYALPTIASHSKYFGNLIAKRLTVLGADQDRVKESLREGERTAERRGGSLALLEL